MDGDWRDAGLGYSVSSDGRVRGPTGRILNPKKTKNGYRRVAMSSAGVVKDAYVHRLICAAFHGEQPTEKHQVDHKNRERSDNRAVNLRWITKAENLAHRRHPRGSQKALAKLNESEVRKIKGETYSHLNNAQIAKLVGVSRETIRDIRLGKYWRHIDA